MNSQVGSLDFASENTSNIILVNVILVLGSERLHNDMSRKFGPGRGEQITLVRLDKSGGCVDRDGDFLSRIQELSIREYFFGDSKRTLSPHTQQINFDEAIIYQIREGKLNCLCTSTITNSRP